MPVENEIETETLQKRLHDAEVSDDRKVESSVARNLLELLIDRDHVMVEHGDSDAIRRDPFKALS
jgi:hypothetical protein